MPLALLAAPARADAPPQPPFQPVAIMPHFCSQYYPQSAVEAHESGDVTLHFFIATDGSVKDVAVSKSSGFADLDAAALSCVATWRYQPVPSEMEWQASVRWHESGK